VGNGHKTFRLTAESICGTISLVGNGHKTFRLTAESICGTISLVGKSLVDALLFWCYDDRVLLAGNY
jgi:hypothetical protein